jgi:dnd system-associated protein 4
MDIYKILNASAIKNSNINDQPFSEAKEVFLWAVSIGVNYGKKIPLSGTKEGLFFWNRLTIDQELTILQLIAIAESEDIYILENEAYIQDLAEEYANFGIRKINELLITRGGSPLNNMIDLIRSEVKPVMIEG